MTRSLRCPICGGRLTPSRRTVDHFIPKALGGGKGMNRWPMCKICNTKKGDRLPNVFERIAYARWVNAQHAE